jgi:acylphosphatase
MKTFRIYISGTVQGVFFRKDMLSKALAIGVRGFIRNLGDGRVEVLVEGRDDRVNEMIEECKKGTLHAKVDKVELKEMKHQGFKEFKILNV